MSEQKLTKHLKNLHLSGILATYTDYALIAEKEKKTYEAFLYDLIIEEVDHRKIKRIARLKKEAKLPVLKSIEEYDFTPIKGISAQEFNSLATGEFLKEASNIVLYGSHGLGKTHLAIALITELCQKGFRCLYIRTVDLIEMLLESKKELKTSELWRKFDRFDLIVCDELGYIPQTKDGADLFFQFISQRYERKSIAITTNLPYSEWVKVFLNEATTAAAVDRIIHRCKTFTLTGQSQRIRDAKNNKPK